MAIKYNDLRYDDDGFLIGIDLSVDAKDGFSGGLTQITNKPLDNIYIYRDYSEASTTPFGLGNQLPDFPKNSETGEFMSSTQLSPGKQPGEENTNKQLSEVVDLRKVETFIINGKTLQLQDIPDMVVLIESYEFADDKTFKVDGKTLKDEDFKAFFQTNDEEFTNKKAIFFMNSEAIFSLFSKSKSQKNNTTTPE
jgi:hypothetical protein